MNETILFSPFFKMLIPDFSNDTVNYQYKQLNGVYNFKNSKISNCLCDIAKTSLYIRLNDKYHRSTNHTFVPFPY